MKKKNNAARMTALVALAVTLAPGAQAQDPHFTQFYANPLYLNPALAGTGKCPRIGFNYRNQWPSISGNFATASVSYDQFVSAAQGGLGLLLLNDRAGQGTYNLVHVAGMYAFHLPIDRNTTLRFGIQAMYVQRRIDWDKLIFGDQLDARYGLIYPTGEERPNSTRGYADFSSGIMLDGTHYFIGAAAHHLTKPDEAFIQPGESPLPVKYTAHGGMMFYSENQKDVTISPNVIYQQQGDFRQLNLGLYAARGPLVGGLWTRMIERDAFILLIGLQGEHMKLGYSYDVTISKLSNASGGAHEVSLSLQFECRQKKPRMRPVICPTF